MSDTSLARSRARFADEAPVLLSVPIVCAELGITRSTFYDWRAKGNAPRCVKLPNGCIRVRRADLDLWLTEREG
ncbi:AlpA family transcriptional regulator [Actinocorallia herbida]|uniref:AlpA family transcriptional regulator n=1 Tax=Actinocorallia herbida TaxID=58109 RepID=A0A3N1DBV7_9ACTN|nr:helix-turn-helix domain-containing protein [Actinocorallia herbida]ROO90598.1 AlpA family transcriptional regulator [Actinocorallia herbida]